MYSNEQKTVSSLISGPVDAGEYFSLVLGGPLYQLYLRARLSTPPLGLVRKRILIISSICWVPLLILSVVDSQALRGSALPFLLDPEVHARFLVAVPLLVVAELIAHQRLAVVVRQFVDRKMIVPQTRPRFEQIIASTMRLRNSVLFEIILLVFCFTVGHWVWRERVALRVATWYSVHSGANAVLSKAGYWYVFVSLPILRFLLFRWYFRIFLWYLFLWRVRGLPLHLNLYHPDRAAGLGFLAGSIFAFSPVLLAQTAIVSGMFGDRIWHEGASLLAFKTEIAGLVLFLILVVLTPLSFFVFRLEDARRVAKREFGTLAGKYVDSFREKWIQHSAAETEPLLGTPDLQSLADLANSFKSVSEIRLLLFSKQTVISLTALLLLPFVPLFLTIIPLKEVLDWILKLAF